MQNKSNFVKSHYIASNNRYYRSIKYNITQTAGFNPNSTAYIDPNKSTFHNNSKTYATAWRKPTSFSEHKTKKSKLVENIENNQDFQAIQPKASYLQTWQKLLLQPQKNKAEELKQKNMIQRVHLPSIVDFQPSNFTSLDPLFIPFQYIQKGINQLNHDLSAPKMQMTQIHHDMINFQNKIIKQLEQTRQFGLKQFQRLRKMLRTDKVQCQEANLRLKRQSEELKIIDQAYKSNFQSTKPRLDILQQQIFSCKPFDLKRHQQLDQQFPQDYF